MAALVEERARLAPSRLAYAAGRAGRRLEYGELGRLAAEWWVRLRSAGLGPGRRAGLQAEDPLVFASSYLGLLAAGVTAVPLDPRLPPADGARHLDRVGADLLITDDPGACAQATPVWWVDAGSRRVVGASGRCRPRSLPDEEDPPAVLLLSSGTTGEPKVVPLREAQVLHVARLIARHHRLSSEDRGYSPLPLFHVNAQVVGLLATLVSGGSLVLDGRFHRTGCWELAQAWRVTWLNLVPAILAILAAGEAPPGDVIRRVRFARTASAPLPSSTQRSFEERCGISVLETYGMSEAASQITANPLRRRRRRQGSAGIPVGVRLRVVDAERRPCPVGEVGSVEIRGPSVIRHYLAAGEPPAGHRAARQADGWLVTGDLGRLDAGGFLQLTGRSDDVINRGGEKVYPREIEEVLRTESGVSDVMVAGQSDPVLGQCPVAYVVAGENADPAALARRLQALAASRLSPSRRPVRLVVVDALPAGATGKVSRRRLAAWEPGHVRAHLEVGEGRAS